MVDNYLLNKVLDKINETIGIEKLDNTKILIYTDDKLPDGKTIQSCDINEMRYKRWW